MTGQSRNQRAQFKRWLAQKPGSVRALGRTLKPWRVYRIKDTGQHCELVGFFQDFTVSVYVTGHDNPALWPLQASSRPLCVFGLHPRDLERIQPSEAFRK